MLAGFACLVIWLLHHTGDMSTLSQQINQFRPDSSAIPSGEVQRKWFSLMLLGGLSSVVYPQTLQRIYAARKDQDLHYSLAAMGIIAADTCSSQNQ